MKKKAYNWDTKIMSALRKVWRFSDIRNAALTAAKSPTDLKAVVCAQCGSHVDKRTAAVDHQVPVVPLTGFDSWDAVIERLKSPALQVLCDPCHALKTKAENAERAAIRKANKPAKAPRKKKVVK